MKAQEVKEIGRKNEKELAELNLKVTGLEARKMHRNNSLSLAEERKGTLEEQCAWVESHFESRRDARHRCWAPAPMQHQAAQVGEAIEKRVRIGGIAGPCLEVADLTMPRIRSHPAWGQRASP